MKIGVLLGANGKVKRTWSLICGDCIVPLEDGDEIIEWELDHGDSLPVETEADLAKQIGCLTLATKMQETVPTIKGREQALLLSEPHADQRRCHCYIQSPALAEQDVEVMYHSNGQLLHRPAGSKAQPVNPVDHLRHGRLERIQL